ncbi:MAG: hypothetical protein IJG45_03665 [Oscillospiraceae bacterium]|nr:hypothetical protein [Oscillospiraceae bacterium]
MKKLHLICNSHIDPVWMWDWEEGMGEAISTFYQAERFCREFDFIFNHNEAMLYEFIEEKDPALFADICAQVKAGKWHVMGGWYLQPDCNLPSGEAFVRQIALGRKYFKEKFGVRPTTAVNFDSFGHSVGLVQILKKCGYDSYLFCRPMLEMLALPAREFVWVGKDGSRIKATRAEDDALYTSGYGTALADVRRKASVYDTEKVGVALWGVGNHGGLPSRKDLQEINDYIRTADMQVLHSTPEQFFADIEPAAEYHGSLPCLIGAYTSMQRIKKKHIELEHKLFTTEKLCAIAAINGLYQKNDAAFLSAQKRLAAVEFHDVLSGTCTQEGERSCLRLADSALDLLQREFDRAFFALCSQFEQAAEGEFPVFLFNAQPYERETVCETEFLVPKALISDTEQYTVTAYQDGTEIPTQCIKEESNINYDRRKRIAYRCRLAPLGITKVVFRVAVTPKQQETQTDAEQIVFSDSRKTVVISRKTGLVERFAVDGKELLSGGAFQPVLCEDNADPWGWDMDRIGKNPVPFVLSDCRRGPFAGLKNVAVVEDGDVLTEVESFFEAGSDFVRISYKLYRELPYMDVHVDVLHNEQQKAVRLQIPTALDGAFFGQIPFATDRFAKDGGEITAQRFIGIEDVDNALALYNNCTNGFSAEEGALYATLLRGVAYSAHPIEDRPLIEKNRFIPYIEQGRHEFSFRLAYHERTTLENRAQEFVIPPYSLCFFPHGSGAIAKDTLRVDNPAVSLAAFYQTEDGYTLRLCNNNEVEVVAAVSLCGKETTLRFGKYETKTVVFDGKVFKEKLLWV